MKGMDAEWWAKQEDVAEYCLVADWIKPENRLIQARNMIYSACGNEALLDLEKKGIKLKGLDEINEGGNQGVLGILSQPKSSYLEAKGLPSEVDEEDVKLMIKSYMEVQKYGFINHDNLFRRPLPIPPYIRDWMVSRLWIGEEWTTVDQQFYYDNFVKPFCEVFLDDNWDAEIEFSDNMKKQWEGKIEKNMDFEDWFHQYREELSVHLHTGDRKDFVSVFNEKYIDGILRHFHKQGGNASTYDDDGLCVNIMMWIIVSIFVNTIIEALNKADYCWKTRNIYKEQN